MSTDWTQRISALAEEEQQRSTHPEVDADHLLLALLGLDGAVSDALRQQGVTLEAARQACERIHTPHHEEDSPGEARYRDGIRATLERAASQTLPDVALLQLLLQDPSERVKQVLQELHITYENLRLPALKGIPHEVQFTHQRVIPASPKTVWAVVSDPTRLHEWASSFFDHCELDPMGVPITWNDPRTERRWLVTVTTHDTRSEHLLIVEKPVRELRWDTVDPEDRTTPPHRLRLTLDPHEQGTDLTLTLELTDFDTSELPTNFAFRKIVLPAAMWYIRRVVTKQLKTFATDIASAAQTS
ncbi:SRPBCC family protein [Arachnia propionica]|uniref:SRPBCC family protein n=1 Tax=Arachnia propionica TaxID=1750 RepID=A0A3P1T4B5_9ACTN|nr:SRPBCC family protein [Arachnia propionica]RRD04311.1 SRPBCC family protein [Arachnia propionica]